jgi:hypothetical protein
MEPFTDEAKNPFEESFDLNPEDVFLVYLDGATLPPGYDANAVPAPITQEGSLRAILDVSEGTELSLIAIKEQAIPVLLAIAPYLPRSPILLCGLENEPVSKVFAVAGSELGSITLHDLLGASSTREKMDKVAAHAKKTTQWRRPKPGEPAKKDIEGEESTDSIIQIEED